MESTIIQLATPRLPSAIHIIRISGKLAYPFLIQHTSLPQLVSRQYYTTLFQVEGRAVDRIVCFFLQSPRSYTGEDMVEIHCHGSLLIVDKILTIGIQFGMQLATPGEFTFRAFLNGKVTLEESEAIDTLVKSNHEEQKQNALQILEKKSSLKFETIANKIYRLFAQLESSIEFPEEDIPEIDLKKEELYEHYKKELDELSTYFEAIYQNYQKGKKIESNFKILLVGSPNVGKSSLVNLLLRENRAIVSQEEGTTRDYLSELWHLPPFKIELFDTAGIHESDHAIEKEGIQKSVELIAQADLLIWLITEPRDLSLLPHLRGKEMLTYINKKDLLSSSTLQSISQTIKENEVALKGVLSVVDEGEKTRETVESDIKQFLNSHYAIDHQHPFLLNERQAIVVEKILTQLKTTLVSIAHYESEELIMEELKMLTLLLDEINLKLDNEKIYDQLFSNFCIGK